MDKNISEDCCKYCHYFQYVDITNTIGQCHLHKRLTKEAWWCSNGKPKDVNLLSPAKEE